MCLRSTPDPTTRCGPRDLHGRDLKATAKRHSAALADAAGKSPERRDYEYERGGVVNLFLFCEPLGGRRWVDVTERRTRTDWAHQIKELVDESATQRQSR
jgi:hypothetical protein